ncbi:MAG TPA: hypothetical protein VJS69_00235 [Candidatus Krumholzibacteria bacterium]|nr:hypothetical protein [Candidatus Krumholzibacteria bacterium]
MRAPIAGITGVLLVAAVVGATAWVQPFVGRPYLHTNLYLPSGKFMEQASLDYPELASDMVWFQAVQYYGGYRLSQHDLAYFGGLIDIVTELDPHFEFPYIFGAVVMAQDMGDIDRGIRLLKRGMGNNPTMYELPFEIGFLYYTVARDDSAAARYFDLASRLPGGKDRAGRFAAFVYSRAGHTQTSIRMWQEIANDPDEQPYLRDLAKHYLQELENGTAPRRMLTPDGRPKSPPAVRGGSNDI